MVSKLRGAKTNARIKKTGHALPVVVIRDGKRYFSDDPEDIKAVTNRFDGRSKDTSGSLAEKLEELIRNEVGIDIHVKGFQLDMAAHDGEVRIEWKRAIP